MMCYPVRSRGFTLVELLVVLTLLSLMVLAMASALRTVAQSQERVDHKLTRIDDYRLAEGLIRDTLGSISARKQARGMDEKASPYLFAGAQDAIAWVGVMPARYGSGGRHFFRLGLESVEGQARLVLRFAPWRPTHRWPPSGRARPRASARPWADRSPRAPGLESRPR